MEIEPKRRNKEHMHKKRPKWKRKKRAYGTEKRSKVKKRDEDRRSAKMLLLEGHRHKHLEVVCKRGGRQCSKLNKSSKSYKVVYTNTNGLVSGLRELNN